MLKKVLPILVMVFVSFVSSNAMADKGKLDLSAYKGKVVMVDFWASWCAPCRKSFPWLNKMQTTLKSKDLVIIGVNVDEDSQEAKGFLKKYPANFKIIYDPKGNYAKYYKIIGMPSSLIFDRKGNLVKQHAGFKMSQIKEYESALNKALAKK